MANTHKDIIITPNHGSNSDDPKIEFLGANSTANADILLYVSSNDGGTLSLQTNTDILLQATANSSKLLVVGNSTVNLIVNAISVKFGNSVANVTINQNTFALANSTISSNLQLDQLNIGANVKANSTVVQVSDPFTFSKLDSSGFRQVSNLPTTALQIESYNSDGPTIKIEGYSSGSNTLYDYANLAAANTTLTIDSYIVGGNKLGSVSFVTETFTEAYAGVGVTGVPNGSIKFAVYPSTEAIMTVSGNSLGVYVGNSAANTLITNSSIKISNSTSNLTLSIANTSAWSATNYFLHANGSWVQLTGVNTDAQYSWTNTQTFTNTITFSQVISGTANNTLYVGSVSAENVVSNAQLSANLSNYQTTAGLSSNVATLTANNSSYLGTVAAANYVQNNDSRVLSGNLNFTGTNNYFSSGFSAEGSISIGNSSVNTIVNNSVIKIAANQSIDFSTSTYKPSFQAGRMYWDEEEKTIVVYGGSPSSDFEISIGQREWFRGKNSSGSTIYKGQPVYCTGVHISGNTVHGHHLTIALADASDAVKKDVIGIAGEDILNGNHGYVVTRGYIETVNTIHLTSGQRFHLGFASPGTLVQTAPEYPNWPMDCGICLTANDTYGTLYVDIVDHSAERFRVAEDVYIGGSLTVLGDFNATGNVAIISATNLNVEDNFIYVGAGDTITTTTFTGSGLNDGLFHGVYEGTAANTFYVKIDATGTPDTFAWSYDNFSTTQASGVAITGGYQTLAKGITIKFVATTGHTLNDKWSGTASPVNVDIGIVGNYNDTVYAHTGIFRDATDGYWKVFDSYTPEPTAAVNIDTANTSFHIANFWANTARFGNTSVYSTINSTAFSGSANNSSYLGGVAASGYQTTAGLSSNVATLTANNANYLGGNLAANFVQNNESRVLSGNLNFTGTNNFFSSIVYVGANTIANTTAFYQGNSTVNVVITSSSVKLSNSTSNITLSVPSSSAYSATNYFLHANGSWVQVTGGGGGTYGTRVDQIFTATAGQNTFSITGGFTNNFIDVFYNGAHLASDEFTQNGTHIQLSVNALSGALVQVVGFKDINLAAALTDVNSQYTWTNTQTFSNTITFSQTINGTANNTSYVGSVSAANVVSNAQLSANLSNYQTTAGLSSNVATLTANNSNYLGGNLAANFVQNNESRVLSGNLNFTGTNNYFSSIIYIGSNSYVNTTFLYLGNSTVNTTIGQQTASLFSNSTATALSVDATGNVTIPKAVLTTIYANGATGTASQVLTANATGGAYWAAAAAGVNTAASYTWTNTHTFYSNTTFGNSTFANTVVTSYSGFSNPQSMTAGVLQTNASLNYMVVGPYTVPAGNQIIITSGSRFVII